MTFSEWLLKQFTNFNVLTMVVIVLFNWFTTTRAVNRQMKDQKIFDEFQEIKDEIARHDKKTE
jgi:hypothetical protein